MTPPPVTVDQTGVVTGNTYDKYGSTNPVVKRLMANFEGTLDALFKQAAPASLLDVGCGEGVLVHEWAKALAPARVVGIDLEEPSIQAGWAQRQAPNLEYRIMLADMSPADLDPSVRATLDDLRSRGLKLAIGSSSKNAKFILERIGLGDYFDAISDGTNISRSKPDPEVFLKAAEYLGIDPAKCVVIEDAVAGIEAGEAAGMYTVSIGDAAVQGAGDAKLSTFADLSTVMTDLGC